MEMLAVIEGLRLLDRPCAVDLFSDSEYVVNGLREWLDGWKAKGWKRGRQEVKNLDLWKLLDELRVVHTLTPQWVRGHANHPENERCDELASAAARHAAGGL
jgi:ribonuclease HI